MVVKAHDINASDVEGGAGRLRPAGHQFGAPARRRRGGGASIALLRARRRRRRRGRRLVSRRGRRRRLGQQVDGVQAPITGQVADHDFSDQLLGSVAPVFAFVVVFAFLLMLLSFRSLTIAITSIVLNLLSVAAAYGILVAVFQHRLGRLAGRRGGRGRHHHLAAAVPLRDPLRTLDGLPRVRASRIREARLRGRDTKDAIRHGVVTTAGVVTSAAVIMVAVFAIFGTLSMQSMKQMGVGLAAAVLIDATIIRGDLPAVMALLGERNWYLPKWLNRLPDSPADESPGGVRTAGGRGREGGRLIFRTVRSYVAGAASDLPTMRSYVAGARAPATLPCVGSRPGAARPR